MIQDLTLNSPKFPDPKFPAKFPIGKINGTSQ
jgi:hypothetical protein